MVLLRAYRSLIAAVMLAVASLASAAVSVFNKVEFAVAEKAEIDRAAIAAQRAEAPVNKPASTSAYGSNIARDFSSLIRDLNSRHAATAC